MQACIQNINANAAAHNASVSPQHCKHATGSIHLAEFMKDRNQHQRKETIQSEFKILSNGHNKLDRKNRSTKKKMTHRDANSSKLDIHYVTSYASKKLYVAAEAPTRFNTNDFWSVVWNEGISCIVMLTELFEHARQQCDKYWHDKHGRYSNIDVWLLQIETFSEFNVRFFVIQKEGHPKRKIQQFQLRGWLSDSPDCNSLLEFIRVVNQHDFSSILVHCGSDKGRTGVYISVDSALMKMKEQGVVEIFPFVRSLQLHDPTRIYTLIQYELVYDSVAHQTLCGNTLVSLKQLPMYIQRLIIKENRKNGFQREFKILKEVVPKISVGECAAGHRLENRTKSRDIFLQPPERARPYLTSYDSATDSCNDFINAVFIDGYRNKNAYVVTQWPLKVTQCDIWRLVFDHGINSLVLLENLNFNSWGYKPFWPSQVNQQIKYGPMIVTLLEKEHTSSMATLTFKVEKPKKDFTLLKRYVHHLLKNGMNVTEYLLNSFICDQIVEAPVKPNTQKHQIVKMFSLREWPTSKRNKNEQVAHRQTTGFVEMISQVQNWNNCKGEFSPTCVMSSDGQRKCGVYCALATCWDRLRAEGSVDVFQSARVVKVNRPQLINDVATLKHIYILLRRMVNVLVKSTEDVACKQLP